MATVLQEREDNNFWQRRKTGIVLLGGSVTWCSRGGNQCDDSSKERKRELLCDPAVPRLGKTVPKRLENGVLKRDLYPYVYSGIVSQQSKGGGQLKCPSTDE